MSEAFSLEPFFGRELQNTTIDYGVCLFPGTSKIYIDCCTDSSYQVCTYLAVMFFTSFVGYAVILGYIMNKNPWIKRHGLYINVFIFQMNVLFRNGNDVHLNSARLVLFVFRVV